MIDQLSKDVQQSVRTMTRLKNQNQDSSQMAEEIKTLRKKLASKNNLVKEVDALRNVASKMQARIKILEKENANLKVLAARDTPRVKKPKPTLPPDYEEYANSTYVIGSDQGSDDDDSSTDANPTA